MKENLGTKYKTLGDFLVDIMSKRMTPKSGVLCPYCKSPARVEKVEDEEHTICDTCGMVAVDGIVVVSSCQV